jgi:hypothetical protein
MPAPASQASILAYALAKNNKGTNYPRRFLSI